MGDIDLISEESQDLPAHAEGLPHLGDKEAAVAGPPDAKAARAASSLGRLAGRLAPKYAIVAVWGLLVLFYGAIEPDKMLRHGTFQTIFGSQQALVFLSMALVVTFIVGEFDLSVASIMGLAATLVPVLFKLHGVDVVTASLIAVACCVGAGVINGFIVVVLGVNPIVTTLGMGTFLLGICLKISRLTTISGLSADFAKISLHRLWGLPVSFYYGVVIAAGLAYVIGFTPLGRHMSFVGANREVARLAGVRVDRIRFGSYVASGLICGVGGVVLVAGLGGYDSTASPGYLLPAFAATFLGTAVVQPGRFNPIGSLVGIYFLVTGIVGLQLLGYTGWIENVFYGAALVIAVSVSTIVGRRAAAAA
jgi:ribose transport system permease protein